MRPQEMIKLAGEAEPELLEKVALTLRILEKQAPVFAKEMARELNEVAEYTLEKLWPARGATWAWVWPPRSAPVSSPRWASTSTTSRRGT